MKHLEFLKNIALFGRGVFAITIPKDAKTQSSLSKWVYRNCGVRKKYDRRKNIYIEHPPLVLDIFKGSNGDVKILKLTKEGMKHFGANTLPSGSTTPENLMDYVLINSYLYENNLWSKFSYKPHFRIVLNGLSIGLLSQDFGPSKGVNSLDILISTPLVRDNYLSDTRLLEFIAKRDSLPLSYVQSIIANSYIPRSVEFLRRKIYIPDRITDTYF